MRLIGKLARRSTETAAAVPVWLRRSGMLPVANSPVRFVVVSTIRTGSSMLVSFLNSHPAGTCFFEPFHRDTASVPFGIEGYARLGRNPAVARLHHRDPVTFADDWLFGSSPYGTRAVGFKLLYTQGRFGQDHWWHGDEYGDWWSEIGFCPSWGSAESDLWSWLATDGESGGAGVRVIHLRRQNLLRGIVSAKVAHKTKKWGTTASGGHATDSGRKVTLDPQKLLRDFEAEARYARETDDHFKDRPIFQTTYEKLVRDPKSELKSIQQFLDLPVADLKTETRRQSVTPLAELVANYDEVADLLRSTQYSCLLDDSSTVANESCRD